MRPNRRSSPGLVRASVERITPAARPHAEPDALPAVTFALVSERSAFDALEPEWNDLFRRAGRDTQLFQTFNWNWHWANHYLAAAPGEGRRRSLAIVTVRRNGRLVMLWPLVAERVAGLQVLHWMGEPVSQYGDILAEATPDTPQIMRQAWHFIATRAWRRCHLPAQGARRCHRRAAAARARPAAHGRRRGALSSISPARPILPATSSATAPRRARTAAACCAAWRSAAPLSSSGTRAARKRRAAALEAIALKRAWLETTGRLSPALADPRFAAFFADAAEGRGRPAGCGVSVLKSNGETAGIAIDVTCGSRRAAHVIVHDARLDAFSPGTLLLQEWIRGASADGIATFDLLAPAYAYKLDWADATVAVEDFALGLTLPGRAYVYVYLGALRQTVEGGGGGRVERARLAAPARRAALRWSSGAAGRALSWWRRQMPSAHLTDLHGDSTHLTHLTPRPASSAARRTRWCTGTCSFLPG